MSTPTPDEELVRRLLADARHDEPMPADVAARLAGVLDELVADGRRPADVTPLRQADAVRRRTRRWTVALVAAAAVVVGGVALREALPTGGGFDGSSAGSSADESSNGGSGAAPPADALGSDPQLAAAHAALGVRPLPTTDRSPACSRTRAGLGRRELVVDGVTVRLLVLRPAVDGNQAADLLDCSTGEVIRSATVPVR